ncbi:MAG: HPr(Ser) kinase/phosphatase [Verrucomicrobiota bacterium]
MPAKKTSSSNSYVRKTLTPGSKIPARPKAKNSRPRARKRPIAKSPAPSPVTAQDVPLGTEVGTTPRGYVSRSNRAKSSVPTVTVGDFYTFHQNILHLRLLAGASGLKRRIMEGAVNRPGLALSGFYKSFAAQRVQVIGSGETAYLKSLPEKTTRQRLRELFTFNIPCIIFARNINPPKTVLEEAEEMGIAVFKSPLTTMRLLNTATICLELDFAPMVTEYGSMIDIQGIGVMIRGPSGIGKSEVVLSLIERSHSLVSDDITRIRSLEGRELIGTSADLSRFHMEVRGLGIINVASIFGVRSIRYEKRLDLVVTLRDWHDVSEVDRIGLEEEFYEVLQIKVPHVTIPVRQGRNLASLVEVAALDQKLKSMGQNSAAEFNERLLQVIRAKES